MNDTKWEPLKEGDILFRVPIGVPHRVRIGYHVHAFLRFCANHPKPFGFQWESWALNPSRCPRCGDRFVEDQLRPFVMITTGYTMTQQFINGEEVL